MRLCAGECHQMKLSREGCHLMGRKALCHCREPSSRKHPQRVLCVFMLQPLSSAPAIAGGEFEVVFCFVWVSAS